MERPVFTDSEKKVLKEFGIIRWSIVDGFVEAGIMDTFWEYVKLSKNKSKWQSFVDHIDDRDEDPSYTQEEMKEEEKIYEEYSENLKGVDEDLKKLRDVMDEKLVKSGKPKFWNFEFKV